MKRKAHTKTKHEIRKIVKIGSLLQKRKATFAIVVKSRKIMGDYVAMHGRLGKNELPNNMRGRIPKNEIWMREDIWKNRSRRKCIEEHEKQELNLMIYHGYTYKEAHRAAQRLEKLWWLKERKKDAEDGLTLKNFLT
jgi:hypothetical protein